MRIKFKDNPKAWLQNQIPKWKYVCPSCKRKHFKNVKKCRYCGCKIGLPVRVPNHLRTKGQIRNYVHKHIFPKISSFQRAMLGAHFTDFFCSNLGTGDLTEFDGSNNAPTVQSGTVHSGSNALKFDTHQQYVYVSLTETELSCRAYFRMDDLPPIDGNYYYLRAIAFLGNSGVDRTCHVYFERTAPSGTLTLRMARYYPASQSTYYSYTYEADTWYCLELYFKKDASAGIYRVYLDDALVVEETGLNTSGSFDIDQVRVGADFFGANPTPVGWTNIYVDDIVIRDTTDIGTFETDYSDGFESKDFSGWDGTTASPSINETHRHCGVYSKGWSPNILTEQGSYVNLGMAKEYYLEFDVQFENLPASGKYFEFYQCGRSGVSLFTARIYNDAGTIKWGFAHRHAGSFTSFANSGVSTNPSADTWYCVKLQIRCSHKDGQAVGIYKMWIDNTELNDITQTTRDTDYTCISEHRFYAYADYSGAIAYLDCVYVQTTAFGDCHAAGAEDDPDPLPAEDDCVPSGTGWLQVFVNCTQIGIFNCSFTEENGGLGSLTVDYHLEVERGDLVHAISDGFYMIAGKVTEITKDKNTGTKLLTLKTKTQRLEGRTINNSLHRSYSGKDYGYIVADVVDFYFDALFSSDSVDQTTGYFATEIDLFDKSVLAGILDCGNRGNGVVRVDKDNVVHYFVRGDRSSGIVVEESNLVDLKIKEVGEPIGKLIVEGFGVSGTAGSGVPEVTIQDRRVTNSTEAQDLATALLDKYGSSTQITIILPGFQKCRYGESIIVNLPKEGFVNEELIIDGVTWGFGTKVTTKIRIGSAQIALEDTINHIIEKLNEQQVNRVSTHVGTETGEADPFVDSTDIIDTSAGETQCLAGVDTQLLSQAANSEDDAMLMAFVEIVIERGASGGAGEGFVTLDIGGAKYRSWDIEINATKPYAKITAMLPYDFSGLTCRIYADMDANVWLEPTSFVIKQYTTHSHSITQPVTHEVD